VRSVVASLRPGPLRIVSLALLLLAGCGGGDSSLEFPETPVLSGQNRYALVVEVYIRVQALPDRESRIEGHLRRGDILEVKGRTPDESWVQVSRLPLEGWVETEALRLFASREQALNAGRLLDVDS
jgi:hypothetical protein